jgi:hypothetical protein
MEYNCLGSSCIHETNRKVAIQEDVALNISNCVEKARLTYSASAVMCGARREVLGIPFTKSMLNDCSNLPGSKLRNDNKGKRLFRELRLDLYLLVG